MAYGETLGCAEYYTATVHWRGGQRVYTYIDKVESVRWTRERRKVSSATAVVAASGVSSGCMERLLNTYEGVHELTLYRDGAPVWQGPITSRTMTVSGNEPIQIELVAADVGEYVRRRLLARTARLSDADLSEVGREVVASTLVGRDPNVLEHVRSWPVGVRASRTIRAYARYGGDELGEVAALGMDWTCVGRALFFAPPATVDTVPQGAITGEHLVGEIQVVSSLADYASRVLAAPQAQDGVWQHLEGVGGHSPVWGMWDHVVQTSLPYNLDGNGAWEPSGGEGLSQAETEAELRRVAQARHAEMSRPPLVVRPGASSHLAASTPISLERLVPGMRVDLAIGLTSPLAVQAAMRLGRVSVEWAGEGERVQVSLVQIGSPDDDTQLQTP